MNNYSLGQKVINRPISVIKINEPNNGLLGNVRTIVKDNNGFLWLATQDGLYKYDGNSLVNFNSSEIDPKRKLLSNDASDIYFDSLTNNLYVLSAYLGVSKINVLTNSVVKQTNNYNLISFFSNSPATRIMGNSKSLIISTNDGIIVKMNFDLDNYEKINFKTDNSSAKIEFIEMLGDKIIWGVEGGNIFCFDEEKKNSYSIYNDRNNKNEIHFSRPAKDKNKILIPSTNGLLELELEQRTNKFYFTKIIKNVKVNYVYTANQFIYYSTKNGFYGFDKIRKITYNYKTLKNSDDEKWLVAPTSILSFDSILFIGSTQGLCILNPLSKTFSAFNICKNDSKLKISHAVGISKINDSLLLICDMNGAFIYNIFNFRIKQIFQNQTFYSTNSTNEESLLSGLGGTYFSNKNLTFSKKSKYKELDILVQYSITQIDSGINKMYYFSCNFIKGFFVWDFKNRTLEKITTNRNSINNIKSGTVNRFYSKNGFLYIVCDNSLSIMNEKTKKIENYIITNPKNSKILNIIMDVCFIHDDIWFAVYGVGLVRLNNNFKVDKVIDNTNGIKNLGLYKIFSFGDTLIITSSNNGLYTYNLVNNKVKAYYEEDGLHGNNFEQFSGCRFNDKIILGGINGFTIIDPSKLKTNSTPPKLYFQEILITTSTNTLDTTNLFLQKLSIPNNYTQAKISFVGLNYQNPKRVNYWYRITELGTNWIDLKNQNFIDLIGISPGKYNLEVKAANEDGVECAPIKMELHFLPKWYQTLLFKILLVLLVAGLLFLLYSFRIKQLKKILTVRQKISQNLHDDIGSTLSAINMYTQVAKLQPQENHFMDSIEENTKEVLGKLDDIIWSTNPKNDKIQNLVERMESFAMPLCKAKNVAFIFNHSTISNDNKISEATRQNLFVMFKEAVNNVLKYAQCKTCTVTLEEKNKNIYCTITDDGIGFETSKPTERNGLLNMQLRAKEIKGSCTITSELKKGTVVFIQLPL